MRFEAVEFGFEVFDVAFFAFAEGALAGAKGRGVLAGRGGLRFFWMGGEGCTGVLLGRGGESGRAYAARFWAFRRLCAGVRDSFSSLLLRGCDCSGLS